ncbi:MAG TPA: hypothetical protein VML55_07370, partial [Planctomycetaceae bacterium]|nr:hypothetical protein [Planctomycetaceae bacterium]
MSQRAAAGVSIALVAAWAANVAVVLCAGPRHELRPMTAWPMFSNSTRQQFVVYHFAVTTVDGRVVEVPAERMVNPRRAVTHLIARQQILRLLRSLREDGDKGRTPEPGASQVPAELLVAAWTASARREAGPAGSRAGGTAGG